MDGQNQFPDEGTSKKQQQWHPIPDDFLEQVYRVRQQVIKDSKGELFEDSTEAIRQMRDERTRELMGEEIVEGQTESFITDETNQLQQRQRRPVTRKTLEAVERIRERIMRDRNGKPFEDSTELIDRMREERTRELMGEE